MSTLRALQGFSHLIEELMVKEGVEKYDVDVKGESGGGANFLGDVRFIRVTSKDGKKVYNLIMKTVKQCGEIKENRLLHLAYQRESFMYRVIFSEMKKLFDSTENMQFDIVPRMYLTCDVVEKETIILENLHYHGYSSWDRVKAMDMTHVCLVLEQMAKYHGASLAMRQKDPAKFKECTKNLTNIADEFAELALKDLFYEALFENACTLLKESGRNDLVKKYKEKIGDDFQKILFSQTTVKDKLVISHGDLWSSNILFRYNNSHEPSGVCFIDFQLSTLDSPAKDLSFFLYTSCDKTILDNFEILMQKYYRSLCSVMEELGCNSNDLFTYEDLLEQYKKYALFSVISSLLFIKLALSCSDEVPVIGQKFSDFGSSAMKNGNLYNSRLIDVFTHFGDNFL